MNQTVNMYFCTGTDNTTMENLNIYYMKEHDQTLLSTALILDSSQALLVY